MYRFFKVKNFRCFEEVALNKLARVNVIAGKNNVGKTALLEALFLHCGGYNPELALRVNAFRGIETMKVELGRWAETPWDSLFYRFRSSQVIELEGEDTETGKRVVRLRVLEKPQELNRVRGFARSSIADARKGLSPDVGQQLPGFSETAKVLELECEQANWRGSYSLILDHRGVRTEPIPPEPPFPAFFQAARMRVPLVEEAERFGKLQVSGRHEAVFRILQLVEPELRQLTMVVAAGQPMLHGDVGLGRLVPLPVMGEGMARLASLVIHMGNAANGVVLVDEIENGLHHSVLRKVWQVIGEVAREFKTQVFATTHSLECIVAAHRAFSESGEYDFRLHRLERVGEKVEVISYDHETLERAIEVDMEVR